MTKTKIEQNNKKTSVKGKTNDDEKIIEADLLDDDTLSISDEFNDEEDDLLDEDEINPFKDKWEE